MRLAPRRVAVVAAGIGVTVVPRMAAGPQGRKVPIRDPNTYRDLGVIWRQGQEPSTAARAFLEMLRPQPDAEGPDDGVTAARLPRQG